MKQGFTLIEIVLSVMASSILMIALFTSYYQVQKVSKSLENVMAVDDRASIFQLVFENDISGAFIPNVQLLSSKDSKDASEARVEKVFYAAAAEEQLQELSFITCNSLLPTINFKPRIARVTYFIKDDINQAGYKILYRLQSANLKYNSGENSSKKYEVIDGIKSLKLEYVFEVYEKEEENTEKEKAGPEKADTAKKKYKVVNALIEDTDEQKIPSYITIKLELWQDIRKEQFVEFIFKIQIYAAAYNLPELKPIDSKPKPETKEDKMPDLKTPEVKPEIKPAQVGVVVMPVSVVKNEISKNETA